MEKILLTPLVAFFIYMLLVSFASGMGFLISARSSENQFKSDTYASGEAYDPLPAAPGYRQFFVIALFFAMLHLGVLMVGSSGLSQTTLPYLIGLILVLVALVLG